MRRAFVERSDECPDNVKCDRMRFCETLKCRFGCHELWGTYCTAKTAVAIVIDITGVSEFRSRRSTYIFEMFTLDFVCALVAFNVYILLWRLHSIAYKILRTENSFQNPSLYLSWAKREILENMFVRLVHFYDRVFHLWE